MDEQAAAMAVVEPVVRAAGYDLVRVSLFTGPDGLTLQVMAEDAATRQLTLDQCAELSRSLSDALDGADPIAGEYRLEVSSPGIDRPLTRPRDFTDWAGHLAKLELKLPLDGRKRFQGALAGVDGDHALILVDGADTPVRLPLDGLHSAKLVLTQQLIAATRPIDTTGADELDTDDTDAETDTDDTHGKE